MSIVQVVIAALLTLLPSILSASDATQILEQLKEKMKGAKSYTASMNIKVDIPFLKAPPATAKIWFKAPDKSHIESPGFALIPKQGADMSFVRLLSEPIVAVDAGYEDFAGQTLRRIKILPVLESAQIAVATVLIDTARLLPKKVISTAKAGGTIIAELVYDDSKAAVYCLPSYVKLVLDIGKFEIPKTMTGDFDTKKEDAGRSKKDRAKAIVEIVYHNYDINVRISDSVFD
jgi:hypothetical protein